MYVLKINLHYNLWTSVECKVSFVQNKKEEIKEKIFRGTVNHLAGMYIENFL